MPQQTALMSLSASGRLHCGEREQLREQFLDDYPGAVLSDQVLPSVAYLHVIKQQCAQKAWEWIPWRRIVSEEHALQKRTNAQRGSLWIWLKFWNRLQAF
jgi:hypothetical protein